MRTNELMASMEPRTPPARWSRPTLLGAAAAGLDAGQFLAAHDSYAWFDKDLFDKLGELAAPGPR